MHQLSNGQFASRAAAGYAVHEAIHSMGAGEVSAHVGQAQFLLARDARLARIPPTISLEGFLAHARKATPWIDPSSADLVWHFRQNDPELFMEFLNGRGYSEDVNLRAEGYQRISTKIPLHPWLRANPIRTGIEGFDRLLSLEFNGRRW
jgi:hypothetical protein